MVQETLQSVSVFYTEYVVKRKISGEREKDTLSQFIIWKLEGSTTALAVSEGGTDLLNNTYNWSRGKQ